MRGNGPAVEELERRIVLSGFSGYTLNDLSSLSAPPNGSTGSRSTLIRDAAGDLFGTTVDGGDWNQGTVYEVAHGSGTVVTLASFNGANGASPYGSLTLDASGNLFGTTQQGGASDRGTVFEIPSGSLTVVTLASFNFTNGSYPYAGVVLDPQGNLFGTSSSGGQYDYGTVFTIAPGSNTVTTLVSFNGGNNGAPYTGGHPYGPVLLDAAGDLFGTASAAGDYGYGTVFEIARGSAAITTLASFTSPGAINPKGGLVMDGSGDLFGTTRTGGPKGVGAVYEVAPGSGAVTTLASFDFTTGEFPDADIILDSSGNLFGTTEQGGDTYSYGTMFEIAQGSNSVTTIARFNRADTTSPEGGVIVDADGNLFGATEFGGPSNYGVVYELPQGAAAVTTLAPFRGAGPMKPETGLVLDSSGDLFGTTPLGGDHNYGTVFEVAHGSNTPTTLASFDNTNGSYPRTEVVLDASGNLFGTTSTGGTSTYSAGTVFEIARGSTAVTTLATFDLTNGAFPSSLTIDASGQPLRRDRERRHQALRLALRDPARRRFDHPRLVRQEQRIRPFAHRRHCPGRRRQPLRYDRVRRRRQQ